MPSQEYFFCLTSTASLLIFYAPKAFNVKGHIIELCQIVQFSAM